MAARMMRTAVRRALVTRWSALSIVTDGFGTGAQPVQVTGHATDRMIGRERIVVDATDGTLTIPTQRAGTKTTSDEFEVTVYVMTAIPGWTADAIEDRCVALVEALLDDIASATGHTLGGTIPGLNWIRAGRTRMWSEIVDIGGAATTAYMAEITLEAMGRSSD